ncbi:uncharacterized membrane protein YheB (UPF0754 family) [Tumebacillus sp. BK434]|uniref:DUF445 family protein n=1 Tax=Tumebacillus sp. BK434 TaxID=2512169 RepID=UPI0010464429|nr:DUF445 family protein [Tumebacillus sp. BK434]TCP53774.1 uncharacterized membrane protein YheB (UPF0754 family) [Tumebacillus sp. BK434]
MKVLFITVSVGALIGLFTNWLAIVMLFRPWTERRLFGMRLPLTPGLIPRRQNELAEKLGEIVEQDLLTPEGLAKSLSRPDLEYAVKRAGINALAKRLNETPTAGQLAGHLFGPDVLEKASGWMVGRAVSFLQSDAGRQRLEGLADGLFDHLRGTLAKEEVRRELARGFAVPLHANLSSGQVTWEEALPEGTRAILEDRLRAQVEPLLEGAARWMQEPQVVQAISEMLQDKVKNIPLLGPMAVGFLTPERVAGDIVPRLQAVLVSSSVRELVQARLQDGIGKFWSKPIGSYISRMSADDVAVLLEKVLGVVLERALSEEAAAKDLFKSMVVNGLLAGANHQTVGDLVHRLVEGLAAYNVRELYITHTEEFDRVFMKGWRWLRGELIEAMPALLDALALRQVVRDQIASYPIPTLEKLILTVVNKELRMITILGGVLGGIIGLVQALLVL